METQPLPLMTSEPNQPIRLFTGPLTIRGERGQFTADGIIDLKWLPRSDVTFEIPRSSHVIGLDEEVTLEIEGAHEPTLVRVSAINMSSGEPARIRGHLAGRLEIGPRAGFDEVVFQMTCMRRLISIGPPEAQADWQIDQFSLHGGGWNVRIDAVPNLLDLTQKLHEIGGCAITHRIVCCKADDAQFTAEAAEEIRTALFYFLSFVEGRWVTPILATARRGSDDQTWRQWGPWRIECWQPVHSWADAHHSRELDSAFSGFMQRWCDPKWKEVIRLGIHWYVESNGNAAGQEAGIILSQMAIDAIAWEYLVNDRAVLNKNVFNGMSASKRMRKLFTAFAVPLDIPSFPPGIGQRASKMKWMDIADAIAAVRNGIVHPDNRQRGDVFGSSDEYIMDAWICGTWLLEVLLLRLIGYTGPYSDRRKPNKYVGSVDPMP